MGIYSHSRSTDIVVSSSSYLWWYFALCENRSEFKKKKSFNVWLHPVAWIAQKIHVKIHCSEEFSNMAFVVAVFWCYLQFHCVNTDNNYRKTSNISSTLVGNKIVDNSDVVGASPVGAAPTTSSFST